MRLRAISAILISLLGTFRTTAETSSQIALTHITIVDVSDGSTKPDMMVLISGNRISAFGSSSEIPLPKTIRVIDGRGKFLIPGFWDMHIHTDGDDRALRSLLASGITGARDMGGDVAKLVEARRRIISGNLAGPRLLLAGPALMGPPSERDSGDWVIHSRDEARHAVDSLATTWRVDFIKVYDGLARDTFLAIADAAKAKGLSFVGHVPASMTPIEVSDLGQQSIEHLEFVPKPCLALFHPAAETAVGGVPPGCDPQSIAALLHRLAQNRTSLDPTIQSFRYFAPAQWGAIFAGFRKVGKQIRQSHVSILAGTDWSSLLEEKGALPGRCLHDELALLVDAGFTPAEVLRAATLNPALFLGLSDSLGTIEVGKIANLVVLEADPLQDIHNTRRIAAVILEGRFLDREA